LLSGYRWIVFVHVAAILILVILHGATVTTTYALRTERRRDRLVALLDFSLLSFDSRGLMGKIFWADLILVAVSGVVLMLTGGWWHFWWPYLSIAAFIGIFLAMGSFGRIPMQELRRALGMPWVKPGAGKPEWAPAEPPNESAIESALTRLRPGALAAVGAGGLALLLWLMMFRPF
jgi:hypothetical protein